MKLIINNIKLGLDSSMEELKDAAAKKLRIGKEQILNLKIIKESVDARKKPGITLVYSVFVTIQGKLGKGTDQDIKIYEERSEEPVFPGNNPLRYRPVIIGSGPSGLFAGLVLAQQGYRPIVLERGECVERRTEIVNQYWNSSILHTETNVQFGEGGAGTFSDGKLTTRINDRRCDMVLRAFYELGAHEEILYKAKPHIGSDILKDVVKNGRKKIEELGGEFRFNSKVTSVNLKDRRVYSVEINGKEEIPADVVIAAIGHSARDTFSMLLSKGLGFIQKPFSIGVRIEHPQDMINTSQYGESAGHPRLGAAEYQLFYKTGPRTVYSFCMCPGGVVVASASEPNTIVTNGMSEFRRDKENANSALVVSVEPGDFGSSHPLAGVEFQRTWEALAYKAGGGDGAAPVQRLEDFRESRVTKRLGTVKPSYSGSVRFSDLHGCLPLFVTQSMKESIGYFDNRLKGFGMGDALLTGVETRTSSPVRIPRGDDLQAIGFTGIYPAGEGAGYAGGIVSAAVDGIRIAEQIIKTYTQPK